MRRVVALCAFFAFGGLVVGCILGDRADAGAEGGSNAAKFEYEVVSPLLTSSKTKNRQKIEETVQSKAKFGWKLVEVEDGILYFERAVE